MAGVDLLPGSIHTDRHNRPSPEESPWPDQVCLREFLLELEGRYDAVLIDNPELAPLRLGRPGGLTWALIPVVPEDYGSQGLTPVRRSIARVQASVNPGLRLLGLVLTQVQPAARIHQLYEATLREAYGGGSSPPGFPTPPTTQGDRPPATDHPLQAAVCRREGRHGPGREVLERMSRSAADRQQGRPPDVKLDELRKSAGQNVKDSTGGDRHAVAAQAASGPPRWRGCANPRRRRDPARHDRRRPSQPPEFDEEGVGLAESLRTRGQLQPCRVKWVEEQGVYMVLVGERRMRAARLAGLATSTA